MSEMPEGWRFSPTNGGVFHGPEEVISLLFMRTLLAAVGYVVEKECPEHGRACWDARCDVRGT